MNANEIRDLLDYDPATGIFLWRRSYNRNALAGCPAGHKNRTGYVVMKVQRRCYRAHRLAWLYVYGEWARGDLDHVNGDKGDNRIANLRIATASQNQANAKLNKRNRAGFKGVSAQQGRWRARIKLNGKTINIGCFASATEAHNAYASAALKYQGEFSRIK